MAGRQTPLPPLLPVLLAVLATIHTARAILCWECNSHYDRNCGDPFRNATFALTDCDQRELDAAPGTSATSCRKIVQKVKDDYRTVRGCGFLSSETEKSGDCYKRAGTFNVLLQYCNCREDGCNDAVPTSATTWMQLLLLAAAIALLH